MRFDWKKWSTILNTIIPNLLAGILSRYPAMWLAVPWESEHNILRIGLKGRSVKREVLSPNNLAFLLDVSGSMNQPNELPPTLHTNGHLQLSVAGGSRAFGENDGEMDFMSNTIRA